MFRNVSGLAPRMALEQLTKENSPRVLVLLYSDFSRSYRIGPAVVDVSIKHSCLGIWKATGLQRAYARNVPYKIETCRYINASSGY
jgi:hypothetical protein